MRRANYRVYTDADTPCDEENFHFVERQLPLPVSQTALVLFDVWATHYIDSWLQRAADITAEKILPLTQALRAAGVTIIHAPSSFVVERQHPESMPTVHQTAKKIVRRRRSPMEMIPMTEATPMTMPSRVSVLRRC